MSSEEECTCEWCGSDGWLDFELDNGKCKMCVVNDCHHRNTDVVSYDLFLHHTIPSIITHHVCMDCEMSWHYTYRLVDGVRSRLEHEDVHSSDIYQDVKV